MIESNKPMIYETTPGAAFGKSRPVNESDELDLSLIPWPWGDGPIEFPTPHAIEPEEKP